ncbi:universal stress protein [Cryobacterium sp. PH29-G1]|uniref:universal stress protein n=1 Tax=Cryobacterium sp. PH29-G1 TaxID=3046211 RepID=UPI0024BA2F75|nr:universal stress protein [Cryobacterium sp. PH29-G1]MDJ0350109.1 universal stress protein [Cryobacterium sp. PH29-G1]
MNRTIVVGIDDSAAGETALAWAMTRAETVKSPVTLMHTVYETWLADGYGYYDSILDAEKKLLADAAERAATLAPTVVTQTELRTGSAPRVLSELSKDAALIVVGTDQKGRVEGELFGSVSLQIAALSTCPVAVIPALPDEVRSGVYVGVDGSADSVAAVAFAAAEADRTGQELFALYAVRLPNRRVLRSIPADAVNERMEEERVVLSESVAGLTEHYPDLVVHQILESDESPARALVSAAKHAQLLVVGTRGRGSLQRLLMGSVSHEVLLHITCPTIVTRTTRS